MGRVVRWIGALIVASLCVIVAPATSSVGVDAQLAPSGSDVVVELISNIDFAPHGDPIIGYRLFVEGVARCRTVRSEVFDLAGGDGGPVDAPAVVATVGGADVYMTGEEIVSVDGFDGYDPTYSFMDILDSDTIMIQSALWGSGPGEVEVNCIDENGDRTLIGGSVASEPDVSQIVPFEVPWSLEEPEVVILFIDMTYSATSIPVADEVVLTLDGQRVEIGPTPDFEGGYVGTIEDETLVNGIHALEITYQGLTNRFPVYVGFGVDQVPAAPEAEVDPDEKDEPLGTGGEVGDDSEVVDPESGTDEDDGESEGVEPLGERDPFRWLVAPREFDPTPPHLLKALVIAVLLILLIGFQGDLVNKTIEENRDRMWVGPRRLAAAARTRCSGHPLTRMISAWSEQMPDLARAALLLLAFSAISASMLIVAEAPTDWWAELGDRMPPIALGTAMVAAVYSGVAEVYERRITPGSTARFRVIVWALVPAALMALVSAAGDFQPPYVYALIAGYLLDDDPAGPSRPELGTKASALPILAGAGALVALAGLSYVWLANLTRTSDGAGSLLLETVLVGSVQAVVFGLMPFTFLDGNRLKAWSTPAWLGVYATGALGFVYVLVLQHGSTTEAVADGDLRPFAVTAALFVAFAAASFLFWGYYRLSSPSRDRAGDGEAAMAQAGEAVVDPDEGAPAAESIPGQPAPAEENEISGDGDPSQGESEVGPVSDAVDGDGGGLVVDLSGPTDGTDLEAAMEPAEPVVETAEEVLVAALGDPGQAGDPPAEGDDGAPLSG